MPSDEERPNWSKSVRDSGPLLGSGIEMAAAIVITYFVGRWLDGMWNSAPWAMVISLFLGASAGLFQFIKTVLDVSKKELEKKK